MSDSLPAVNRSISDNGCRIYFSLSKYNSKEDIQYIQLSLINQKTNGSALHERYKSGIKLYFFATDTDKKDEYNHYITIQKSDLKNGQLEADTFYKIQLRLVAKGAKTIDNTDLNPTADWLLSQQNYFSEWSKVCLIKGIDEPVLSLKTFGSFEQDREIVLGAPLVEIVGTLDFGLSNESERLKSYNIKLYDAEHPDELLIDSGQIYANEYKRNELNYQLPYSLSDGIPYILILSYVTNNGYSKTFQYAFRILQHGINPLKVIVTPVAQNNNGRIAVNISPKGSESVAPLRNVTIRRTSSKSDFKRWEDVFTIPYSNTNNFYVWYDNTVESGVWYKYCVQQRNGNGDRGTTTPIELSEMPSVMCVFEDMFLINQNAKLKLQFNPTLTDFKYNVSETQQIGIGAKYPSVKRNSNNYFRTFQIGGLITSFIDKDWYNSYYTINNNNYNSHKQQTHINAVQRANDVTFTSKDEIYQSSKLDYENYNQENNISEYQDEIYEREFRQKVYDFLYKHDAKLFKSTTEGNILIKLMNISFQPNPTLGRRLYSFTATAVEIDEVTAANCDKYNIQKTGSYEKETANYYTVLGQLQGTFGGNGVDIVKQVLNQKYRNKSRKGFINSVNKLTHLKLEIDSPPYPVANQQMAGYLIYINNTQVVIPAFQRMVKTTKIVDNQTLTVTVPKRMGYFELNTEDVPITSLVFDRPLDITLDYLTEIEEKEDTSKYVIKTVYYQNPGQIYGTFDPGDKLIKKLYRKYFYDYKDFYQRIIAINGVRLQGRPGTVVYVKDSKDADFNRHILENGYLQLMDDFADINEIYFAGIHLSKLVDYNTWFSSNRTKIEDLNYATGTYDEALPQEPVHGTVYKVSSQVLLYNDWFDDDNRSLLIGPTHQPPNDSSYDLNGNQSSLILDKVTNDDTVNMVYYYGNWFTLNYLKQHKDEIDNLNKSDIRFLRENEYTIDPNEYSSLEDIHNPINQCVYLIGSVKYIYYNNDWYIFNQEFQDVLCPVDGIVDYFYEMVKGEYGHAS